MENKHLFKILFFILVSSCCPSKVTQSYKDRWQKEIQSEYEFPPRNIPNIEIIKLPYLQVTAAVFPKNYTMGIGKGIENNYTPTLQDIQQAEKILNESSLEDLGENSYPEFNKRQYIGFYNEKKEKILMINFLKIKTSCQKNSSNAYLFDKYFLDINHPDDVQRVRLITLNQN